MSESNFIAHIFLVMPAFHAGFFHFVELFIEKLKSQENMSDYRDIVRESIEKGFYLDSCGEPNQLYTWGSFIDLCGMSVEDANSANWECGPGGGQGGSESAKTKNTITFLMQKGPDEEYTLYLNTEKIPNEDVTVSFTMDGDPHIVTIPSGTKTFNTGLKGKVPTKPYATIASVSASSDDEQYDYKTKNSVKTGVFTFTINNNGVETTQQVQYGEEIALPSAEEREGYDFVWTDENGNVLSDTYTMPESNATITGKYIAKSYVLTYTVKEEVLNGGTVSESVISSATASTKYGDIIWGTIKDLTPARTGYTAGGWASEDGVVNSTTKMPAKDFSVENVYRLNKHTLTFKADNVTIYSEELYYGQEIVAPIIPEKVGYEAVGWNDQPVATMPDKNLTYTAVYSAITYYIRYYVDGAEMSAYTESHIYQDPISIRADETKEGHTFSGWNPSELPSTMPAEDINVSGTFEVNTYHFALKVDGKVYFEKDYTFGEPIDASEITPPEKEGYTFQRWEPEIPDVVPSYDMEFNAVFTVNSHVLSYTVDGELYYSANTEYGTEIILIDEPVREGYTFSGWGDYPTTMPDNDVEISGAFNINSYVLSYFTGYTSEMNGKTLVYSAEVEYNASIQALSSLTMEGYTFSGWKGEPSVMPASDVEVNGWFNINSHTLIYRVDNVVVSEEIFEYGTPLVEKEHPEKEGYTFSGWTSIPATMPDEDVIVDGWFNVNQYTLKFFVDGEPYGEFSAITQDYGTNVPEIPVPEKEGYTFSGWDKEIPQTIPAEDMEFNGTLNINHWVATFIVKDENSAITYSSQTEYEYGATIVYPKPTVPEGYMLKWIDEYTTMPNTSITINGIYEVFVASKTVYYGMIYSSGDTTFTDAQSLNSYDYVSAEPAAVNFVIPADAEYGIMEDAYNDDEITDEEFYGWVNAHINSYIIFVPSNATLASIKNAVNSEMINGFTKRNDTVTINGTEYNIFTRNSGACNKRTNATYKTTVTIND